MSVPRADRNGTQGAIEPEPTFSRASAIIAIALSLFAPPPPPPPFLYDTYDRSGAVAKPGHYAFLADADDLTSAVATYEESCATAQPWPC